METTTHSGRCAKMVLARCALVGLLVAASTSNAAADTCRTGFRIMGTIVGAVTGVVVDVSTLGITAGQATILGSSTGTGAGYAVGEAVCPERAHETMIEERSLREVLRACLNTGVAYGVPIIGFDKRDFCTVPINPYIRGTDVMGLWFSGRQLDAIDVFRQVRASFQVVERKDKRAKARLFARHFARNLKECIDTYEARWKGLSSRGATDRCYVRPTAVTSDVWGGRAKNRMAHVWISEVLRAVIRSLPERA